MPSFRKDSSIEFFTCPDREGRNRNQKMTKRESFKADTIRMTDTTTGFYFLHSLGVYFKRHTILILSFLVVVCLASRLLFLGKYLEGWDSIDFALGLHDFDITYFQPHFPGYPVYMFLCRLVHLFTDNDTLALTIPCAVLGSITLVPLYYLSKRMFSEKVALLTAFMYMVNPLCWLQSEKALSDTVGLFFIILSVQLLFYATTTGRYQYRYLVYGSIMFGICLGVRLSYFPFIILWLYVLRTLSKTDEIEKILRYGLFGFFTGIFVWLVPLLCVTGAKSFIINGSGFTFGHFSDWGGSVLTSQNVFSRFTDFVWCLFCNGLGFWCYDTSVFRLLPSIIMGLGIIVFLKHVRFDSKSRFITFYILPYLLWVFFCQNLEKPRHVLPLIPMIIICISAGLMHLCDTVCYHSCISNSRQKVLHLFILFAGILVVSMGIISVKIVNTHKNELITQMQLLDYVGRNYDGKSTRIYCWETKRFFEYYVPLWDARRARNIDDLRYDIEASVVEPEVILSTSMVDGINSTINGLKVVEFNNNRYINNPYHKLTLYRLRD